MGPIDVKSMLATIAALLKQDPGFRDLVVDIAGYAPPLHGDANLLTIVFQNLVINAAQAMQGRGAVRVVLSVVDGRQRVDIIDSGPGLPSEVRKQLFKPFLTTKARGTGLGLATARRLIELHDGHISLTCPADGGTVVRVELPSASASREGERS
jgi:signal transduction histidine kinase